MLEEIHVRDLALIEESWLEFGPGMTVLTGETGAGKTALLGALKLLLGERADSASVRAGAAEALVEGRFRSEGTEMVVKRRVSADGRSRCVLDGEMATVGTLAQRVGPLVDLHGQHEHQALLSPASHVQYLDAWAGVRVSALSADYRDALASFRDARERLAEYRAQLDQAAHDADYLRFVADEIAKVDPQEGEDAALEARLPALVHAERLSAAASEAARLLRGEGGASDHVAQAQAALSRVTGIDPGLDAIGDRLAEVYALVDDVGAAARAYRDSVEHDPAAMDAVQSRLSELTGLMRKHGPTLDAVLARRDEIAQSLGALETGEDELNSRTAALAESETRLRDAARELDAARVAAAPGFVGALQGATADLAMEGARFEVSFVELDFDAWNSAGPSRVEFLYAPAAAQPARPLARIASGGELSRVMLALKGTLGAADDVETLVFDEIDAGIGGATASSVGRRLAELARTHQVIVVTHLAQVAVFADAHLVVRKTVVGDQASTDVSVVSGDERLAEVARMLSGSDSEASRAHARELVSAARDAVTAL